MNLAQETLALDIAGAKVTVAGLRRTGTRPPLLCLHGFGSTKEDYADLALHPAFAERGLILLDAPGCGQSTCERMDLLSIPFLRQVAEAALAHLGVERYHLLGHSMGGLTALLLAAEAPDRVLSFTNIEGNVAPEDCFLSRQIRSHPARTPQDFLDALAARINERPEWASRLYTSSLPHKVRAEAVAPIFESMVAFSDDAPLMEIFTSLAFPRLFVYGAENSTLSYLAHLREQGVELAEIPFSGHWPMYANPPALWARVAAFLDVSDAKRGSA